MTAQIIPLARPADVDAAWEAYSAHRAKETFWPMLVNDLAHVAEGRRLHAHFMELYTGAPSAVVIPFRRRKG